MLPEYQQALLMILVGCIGAIVSWLVTQINARSEKVRADTQADIEDTAIKSKSVKFVMDLSQRYVETNDRLLNLERAYSLKVEEWSKLELQHQRIINEMREQISHLKVQLQECMSRQK